MFGLIHRPSAALFFSLALALLLSACGGVDTRAQPNAAPPDEATGMVVPVPQHDANALEAAMAAIPAGDTDDERIRAILLHLKAKRDSITSYSMDIAWERFEFPETPIESPLPKGVKVNYGEGTWTEQDGMWRVHRRKRWERPERPDPNSNVVRTETGDQGEYESWAVYNGEYFAFRQKDSAITLFPQEAIEAKVVIHEPERFPFPLEWGFNTGSQKPLMAQYEKAREFTQWRVEEIDEPDGPKVRIYYGDADIGGTERVLDPLRDFLVVRVSSWDAHGKLTDKKLELQQLEDGRWFPKRATEREKDKWRTYEFSNVRFNQPVEASHFTVESFDFDRQNTILIRRRGHNFASGEKMLFRNGQWVPESMVPPSDRPRRRTTG